MHLILERLAAKIKQTDIVQQSSRQFCIEHMFDPDFHGEFVPCLPGDDAYEFIGHSDAMFPDGGGLTEKTAHRQKPDGRLLRVDMSDTFSTAQITANDIRTILDQFNDTVKVLSLDCFDTLLWRKTATPKDVFAVLAANPVARSLGITPHQRISAAARAYRAKALENGFGEIDISDIYQPFTSLSGEERELLVETEILTEMNVCYAFSPCVELIRLAHSRGIKIVVVSDTYLRKNELRRLLARHLPADVMQAISKIYCSVDYGTPKSHALFQVVIKECGVPASQILHIGDNDVSDAQAPRKLGVRALHFRPFDHEAADFLRLQNAASSLIVLEQAAPETVLQPRYSPFRPVFSVANLRPYNPETVIGYMSFGPVLYAYARFLMDEVEALQQQGKRVRVFFLLRDAYLLSAACEAYARKPVGKLIRIRKFIAIAVSFKTRADVDYYIRGIELQFDNLHATAKQLLLPPEVTELLIRIAHQSDDPKTAFHQLLHDEDVLELIFKNSAALRARLMRYMSKELELEEGDTVILADIGYIGRTQEYLVRTFKEELKVDIVGCYLVASDEPYRAVNSKALITSPWWNYTLFEQCCAFKEGTVVDYDMDGEPILGSTKVSESQYNKVASVQGECLRFINDARTFFTGSGVTHEYSILQQTAHAALFRHAYMPIEAELEYFKDFQHDKFMGPHRNKTIYHLESAWKNVRCLPSPYRLGAYETRSLGLDFTFSGLVQRRFQLDLGPEDMNVRFAPLKVSIGSTHESNVFLLRAHHLHDGYFSIMLPYVSGTSVKLLLGEHYEWLQISDIQMNSGARSISSNVSSSLDLEEINRQGEIYRCLSQASVATIPPVDLRQVKTPHYYHIIFRPLVSRASDPPLRPGASQ
ncbi:HAD family hydrolase [Mesorhizobium carmichaelinearum]|uniref:HAD family hydrolase n=1 Tax=Mesorhizobium carmichaelinearum TaxID=1208188 RepID=UPI000BA35E71|nr:HAD family hydrolase [Mesorhizobium carmichaelinearum]